MKRLRMIAAPAPSCMGFATLPDSVGRVILQAMTGIGVDKRRARLLALCKNRPIAITCSDAGASRRPGRIAAVMLCRWRERRVSCPAVHHCQKS